MSHRPLRRAACVPVVSLVALVIAVSACDRLKALAGKGGQDASPDALEDVINEGVRKETSGGPELRKDTCTLLTRKMVSEALGVPEADLTQRDILGCHYTVEKAKAGSSTVEASLNTVMTHKSVDNAKVWFKNATTSKTREELAAEMVEVKRRVMESGKIDSAPKKGVVDVMGDELTSEGITFAATTGVGDEASIKLEAGSVYVRKGNLTFSVQGYKGAAMPSPKMVPGKNPQQVLKEYGEQQKAWHRSTIPQRREYSLKLAKLVVASLE